MNATLAFALSLFTSIALVPLLIRYAGVLGLIDTPDGHRKIHTQVIPRSGGLAMAVAFFLTVLYFSPDSTLVHYLVGAVVIVILGVLDDRFELPYHLKFLGQIFAIVIFLSGDIELGNIPFFADALIPEWVAKALLFFFILAVTNAIALSDGLDGLAAGTTVVSLGLIAYLGMEAGEPLIVVVALAIIGASLGFLRYNTHPAQVFMGDTGSQFLGYSSSCLAVTVTQLQTSAVSPLLPLIIFSLPLLDTTMVMVIRIYQGRSPFSPDKNHIHHQLMKFGLYHYEAVALIYVLQFALIFVAYLSRFETDITVLILFLSLSIFCLGLFYSANHYHWTFHAAQPASGRVERRNLFLRHFNWVYLYSAHIISGCLAVAWCTLSLMSVGVHNNSDLWALLSMVLSFFLGILLPKFLQIHARIIGYSVSALTLYPLWLQHQNFLVDATINCMVSIIAIFLILSIRLTRKEQFKLDNQDILVLLILFAGPMLPNLSSVNDNIDIMLLRLAVMIYAVEYVINRQKGPYWILVAGGVTALFISAFI